MTIIANDVIYNLQNPSLKSNIFDIPDGMPVFKLSLKRCTTDTPTIWADKNSHIGVTVFISIDGGVNWEFLTGYTTHGGIIIGENGQEETANVHTLSLNPESKYAKAKGRKIQVSFSSIFGTPPELTLNLETK